MTTSWAERETGGGGLRRTLIRPYAVSWRRKEPAQPARVDRGSSRRSQFLADLTRVYQVEKPSSWTVPVSPSAQFDREPP